MMRLKHPNKAEMIRGESDDFTNPKPKARRPKQVRKPRSKKRVPKEPTSKGKNSKPGDSRKPQQRMKQGETAVPRRNFATPLNKSSSPIDSLHN